MGCLGYVSIRVFESDYIWCSCDIIEWEDEMNHASLNTNAIFGIYRCCGSSIYGLTITRASMMIPWSAIGRLPFATAAGLNACAFLAEWRFLRFGVHLECFLGGLRIH